MKTIQPIAVWHNGENKQADLLRTYISYDDLNSRAVLQYELRSGINTLGDVYQQVVTSGHVNISGTTYDNWGASGDSNTEAYIIVANMLNLTITGDYVPPVVEVPDTGNG